MKKKVKDWLLGKTLAEQNVMFENVLLKIVTYKAAFGLTGAWVESVELICQTFLAAYASVMENRATAKQLDTWFSNLLKEKTDKLSALPQFTAISLPSGAAGGLYAAFREKMEFFKANEAYTRADGENLMIVSAEGEERGTDDALPELKTSVNASGEISVSYMKADFDGLELQWRAAGAAMWQAADKSTEKTITFTPESVTPPAKIELRGVYLLKNQRVGQWSPVYSLTIS